MVDPVKRSYSSTLRAAQARETRRLLVSSAALLFTEQGYGRTTIDAIAAEAGVSRKTVFTAVGGKVELLKLALDWAVTGDDEPVPLLERQELDATKGTTSPEAMLHSWVEVIVPIAARIHGLSSALAAAASADEAAQALRQVTQTQRLTGAHAFAVHLAAHDGLREGMTVHRAADILWLYSDPAIYHRLVTERGWPETYFKDWLLGTVTQQLLPRVRHSDGDSSPEGCSDA